MENTNQPHISNTPERIPASLLSTTKKPASHESARPVVTTSNTSPNRSELAPPVAPNALPKEVNWLRELGPTIMNAFKFAVDSEKRERDYLVNDLGLKPEKLAEIQKKREELYVSLKSASVRAPQLGVTPKEYQRAVLASYVGWMQSQLGPANYDQMQRISMGVD